MKKLLLLGLLAFYCCKSDRSGDKEERKTPKEAREITSVSIEPIFTNDSLSIRAIEVMGSDLAFAANKGVYGLYNSQTGQVKTGVIQEGDLVPEFRAVASTANDFFLLSVGSPALLYKTGDSGAMELVYREDDPDVFYDAMNFWNDQEGIAIGDPTGNCLSVIITRDGGASWEKLSCETLPEVEEGEAAFAASNTNIALQGDQTWIISGGIRSRVFYSPDKGSTWEVFDTPLVQGEPTTGGYSIDFYDNQRGYIIGGDYTRPEENAANKALSDDGGRTWKLVGKGVEPGYKSCVRFLPGGEGQQLIATGFSGISWSVDGGQTWEQLSEEGFYSFRFVNDSLAYAAGKGRIARLDFK